MSIERSKPMPGSHAQREPKEPGLRGLIGFASASLPLSALGMPIVIFLPAFYAQDMGLGLSVVGTVFMLTRFWDILNDPIAGPLMDRFQHKASYRALIAWSTPVLMLSAYALFMPPDGVTATYLLVTLFLLYGSWTIIEIARASLSVRLSGSYHGRSRVQGVIQQAVIIGGAVAMVVPAIWESTFGGDAASRVTALGWLIIALLPPTIAISLVSFPAEAGDPGTPVKNWGGLLRLLKNKPFLFVLFVDLMTGFGGGMVGTVFMFFATHALVMQDQAGLLLLVFAGSGLLLLPAWLALARRIGKHRAAVVCAIYNIIARPAFLLIPTGDETLYIAYMALTGATTGVFPVLLRSMTVDIISVEEEDTGESRPSSYFAMLTLTGKIGLALSVGFTFYALDLMGFDPAATNPPGVVASLVYFQTFAPMIANIFILAVIGFYPLTEATLARRRERNVDEGLA